MNTMNESVGQTIKRDLMVIWKRLFMVLWLFNREVPQPEVYEQWDIFGPLIIIITMGVLMNFTMGSHGSDLAIALVTIMLFISAIVALNLKLIGGNTNIMGSICLLFYSSAPLIIAIVVVAILIRVTSSFWIYFSCYIVTVACALWCVMATHNFFKNVIP